MADELEQVNNTANLTYTRPFDRGYLTNWQSELQVWRRVLGPEGQLKVRAVIRPFSTLRRLAKAPLYHS